MTLIDLNKLESKVQDCYSAMSELVGIESPIVQFTNFGGNYSQAMKSFLQSMDIGYDLEPLDGFDVDFTLLHSQESADYKAFCESSTFGYDLALKFEAGKNCYTFLHPEAKDIRNLDVWHSCVSSMKSVGRTYNVPKPIVPVTLSKFEIDPWMAERLPADVLNLSNEERAATLIRKSVDTLSHMFAAAYDQKNEQKSSWSEVDHGKVSSGIKSWQDSKNNIAVLGINLYLANGVQLVKELSQLEPDKMTERLIGAMKNRADSLGR
jgi:hypothetical protein